MIRVELKPGGNPHFIGAWSIESHSVCDDLIRIFESSPQMHSLGSTNQGYNPDAKLSVDLCIQPRVLLGNGSEPIKKYLHFLHECYRDYLAQWPFLGGIASTLEMGTFNIQRYQPGQHFNQVHSERTSRSDIHRLLVWMTYLNDVESEAGGETHFLHYSLTVRPRKGLTLIWPVEWTHAHRGNTLQSGLKYIITGWMHFPFE